MDLSLVPLKDLADEIIRRSACGIIHVKTIDEKQIYWNWCGPYYEALGYCSEISRMIQDCKNEEEENL